MFTLQRKLISSKTGFFKAKDSAIYMHHYKFTILTNLSAQFHPQSKMINL